MQTLAWLWHLILNNQQHIGLAFAGAGGISGITQFLKRLRKWDEAAWIQTVVLLLGSLTAFSDWYLNNYSTHFANANNPESIVAVTTVLFTLATFLHKWPITQISKFIENKLAFYLKAGKYYKEELVKESATSQQTPAQDDSAGFVS